MPCPHVDEVGLGVFFPLGREDVGKSPERGQELNSAVAFGQMTQEVISAIGAVAPERLGGGMLK